MVGLCLSHGFTPTAAEFRLGNQPTCHDGCVDPVPCIETWMNRWAFQGMIWCVWCVLILIPTIIDINPNQHSPNLYIYILILIPTNIHRTSEAIRIFVFVYLELGWCLLRLICGGLLDSPSMVAHDFSGPWHRLQVFAILWMIIPTKHHLVSWAMRSMRGHCFLHQLLNGRLDTV